MGPPRGKGRRPYIETQFKNFTLFTIEKRISFTFTIYIYNHMDSFDTFTIGHYTHIHSFTITIEYILDRHKNTEIITFFTTNKIEIMGILFYKIKIKMLVPPRVFYNNIDRYIQFNIDRYIQFNIDRHIQQGQLSEQLCSTSSLRPKTEIFWNSLPIKAP